VRNPVAHAPDGAPFDGGVRLGEGRGLRHQFRCRLPDDHENEDDGLLRALVRKELFRAIPSV